MTILLVALIPAIFVWVIANATRSFGWLLASAIVAAVFGMFSGNPAYAAIDLFFVACAFFIAVRTVKFRPPKDEFIEQKASWGNRNPKPMIYGPITPGKSDAEEENSSTPSLKSSTQLGSQPEFTTPVRSSPTSDMKLAPARWVSLNPEKEARKAKWKNFRDTAIGAVFLVAVLAAIARLFGE